MAPEPERSKSTTLNEWWANLDLRAALNSDPIANAHREALVRRREEEYLLGPEERKIQNDYFHSRLDEYLADLRQRECNGAVSVAGRFVADFRCYAGADEHVERRGLVELRTTNGESIVIIGERLRQIGSGAAAVDLAFSGMTDAPTLHTLLSPRAYSSELSRMQRILMTPVGQQFLDAHSALYCLIRERLAQQHGAEMGWKKRLVGITPHWAGEETSFTLALEGSCRASVHLDYVADLCELAIRTHRLK